MSRKPKVPFAKLVSGMIKNAIRRAWMYSHEYEQIFNTCIIAKGQYQCKHCQKIYTNKANLYLEHIIPVELHTYSSYEQYVQLVEDSKNIEVWCKECRPAKDKSDKKLIKDHKKNLLNK